MAIQTFLQQFSSSLLFPLLLIIIALYVFSLKPKNKPNLPPSPPKLPIIGNIHQLGKLPHRSLQALSKKHGPLMLLQLGQKPTLIVSSADVARQIVKTHDIVFSDRPQTTAAKIFLYGCKDVAFVPYGEDWRQKRKVCVLELLSVKMVKSFQFIRDAEIDELMNRVRKSCLAGGKTVINLSEMLMATSNNIVSRSVLGQKCEDTRFAVLARKLMVQFVSFCFGDFFESLGWVDVVTGKIPKLRGTIAEMDAFFDQVISEQRRKDKTDEKDFVDILLQLQDDGMLDFEFTHETLKAILMVRFCASFPKEKILLVLKKDHT